MPVTLQCSSRPRDDQDAEPHSFEAQGDTYDQAFAAAQASVPDGQHRATVPAERLIPLDHCSRLPSGEIRHRCEGHDLHDPDLTVWV